MKRFERAIWLIKKRYFKQLLFRLYIRLDFSNNDSTKNDSLIWCKNNSVDKEQLINMLELDKHINDFKSYEKEFKKGKSIISKFPTLRRFGGGAIDILYALSEKNKCCNVFETGVAYGWSSLALLLSLQKRNGSLTSTDMPYIEKDSEKFVGCIIPDYLRKYWTLIREPDIIGVPKALSRINLIDLCHYDSDKSYKGRLKTYPLLWGKLKKGGVFISDDIDDNLAFRKFSEAVGKKPVIFKDSNKYVGILIK